MHILVIDLGGSNVKVLATGQTQKRKSPSGPDMGPGEMVAAVRAMTADWLFEAVTFGYPGLVRQGRIVREPQNLAPGWADFDYAQAFGAPVKIINDASMQALGSYDGGRMLFLGLGTGLGSALVANWQVISLALGDLPYRRRRLDEYLNKEGLRSRGRKRWTAAVFDATAILRKAFEVDYVVLGGGNADELAELPPGARRGSNENAFCGGFRMWKERFHVLTEQELARQDPETPEPAVPLET